MEAELPVVRTRISRYSAPREACSVSFAWAVGRFQVGYLILGLERDIEWQEKHKAELYQDVKVHVAL